MKQTLLQAMCFLSFGTIYCNASECTGPWRELKKVTDIQSTVIDHFLQFVHCHKREDEWDMLTGECLHSPDCVGIRSSISASICTLSSEPSGESIETDDLWLVVNKLERFKEFASDCDALLNGRCYKAYVHLDQWIWAKTHCENEGGSLVVICDEETNNMVKSIMQERGWNEMWLGSHDRTVEFSFEWISPSRCTFSSFTDWHDNEPAVDTSKNCVQMYSAHGVLKWDDVSCLDHKRYICEFLPPF